MRGILPTVPPAILMELIDFIDLGFQNSVFKGSLKNETVATKAIC